MNRRPGLALAAVLAATVLTGGAAILGLAQTTHTVAQSPVAVVQAAAPTPQQNWEGGD
jgi:hypothetical protein